MTTENFQHLIRLITGRDFSIKTEDKELQFEKEYVIYRILPVTKRSISFTWKTPKSDEKMLRSFITAFTSKYREPNPANYTTCAPYFSPSWNEMTAEKQEFAYYHHSSNMYNKEALLKQVENNFAKDGIAIHHSDTYDSPEQAREKLREWMKRYEAQGYYSSNRGRIPLNELESYCTIKKIEL